MKKHKGFTLIELLVAISIFAIIASLSYKIISSLIITKKVVENGQKKWGGVANAVFVLNNTWDRALPLVIRDENGLILPAVVGKNTLNGKYDSQLEFSVNGFLGDEVFGSTPPKRVGFRFVEGKLYLVSWPVLNRVRTTVPQMDVLIDHISKFKVSILDIAGDWVDTWPVDATGVSILPQALRVTMKLDSGEEVIKQWAQ